MKRGGFLLPVMLLASCALVGRLFPPAPPAEPPRDVPDELSDAATRLPAVESMVAGIALGDLLRLERAETADLGGLLPDGGIREPDDGGTGQDGGWDANAAYISRCLQNPANYEVWTELDPARNVWKVVVSPDAPCHYEFFGGGAYYEIDASSYEILRIKRYE